MGCTGGSGVPGIVGGQPVLARSGSGGPGPLYTGRDGVYKSGAGRGCRTVVCIECGGGGTGTAADGRVSALLQSGVEGNRLEADKHFALSTVRGDHYHCFLDLVPGGIGAGG